MRKLKKSNGAHADDLVREGGRQLQSYLSEMHRFEVSLELSVDELFGSDDDDASIPVLLISKVCD